MGLMTPRQAWLLNRKCWRKKSYKTMKAARHSARDMFRRRGVKLYPYKCTGCGEVHLTKQISAKGEVI